MAALRIRTEVWAVVLEWPNGDGYVIHWTDTIHTNALEGFYCGWPEIEDEDIRSELETGKDFETWYRGIQPDQEASYNLGKGYCVRLRRGHIVF